MSTDAVRPDGAVVATIRGCAVAHRQLEQTLEGVDEETVSRPSRLADWTVGHVLTHIARNADSYVRMLDAAATGESVEQYAGGPDQREADIEAGARRSAHELVDDVRTSSAALEAAWEAMPLDAWRGHGLALGSEWPCRVLPFHRWREVELHHVDLGLGYEPVHWPDDYVRHELEATLATLPERLHGGDARAVLAWLVGRGDQPPDVDLAPWAREHYHAFPPFLGGVDPRPVTIFRSWLRDDARLAYEATAERMADLARTMPGFLELKTFVADDGERVSLVTFATPEAHAAWRAHPDHRAAQQRGREEFYDAYDIQVCRVISERCFRRSG